MDTGGFDRISLEPRRPEPRAHRLAVIGILIACSPIAIAILGYMLTPSSEGFGRLESLVWGVVAAGPAGIIAILCGIAAVRRKSALGYLTILAGCPSLAILVPYVLQATA